MRGSYVRGGGDGYDAFGEKAANVHDGGPNLEEVLADYLSANAPYEPMREGRVTAN